MLGVFESSTGTYAGGAHVTRVRLDAFHFNHAAAVLVLQGMPIQDLFPPDCAFAQDGGVLVQGPFLYLRGKLSPPHDPPLRLIEPVFAAIESVPEGMTREELLSSLLASV